ncbi:hypothetical protein FCIRC_12398 [Fusarium circinatum]|uniref:Ankyrin n=1 Tax=Fusarium circinatum TaxID=48490 RepID=A0A8H5WIG8_FUSCI|nr:hypothetical protein FCIRC_12398 [Fusarium circinatum]
MASQESGQNNSVQDESFKKQLDKAAESTRELENQKPNPVVEKITEYVPAAAKILPARQNPPKEEDKPPGPPERPHHDDKIEDFDDGMSPFLGITPPTDIVAKQRPDGEFPISKGYNLLSVSRDGKGNATPNYLRLIKDAIALGGITVQAASRYLLPSAVEALKPSNSDRIVRRLLEAGADIRRMSISHSILLYARTTASAKLLIEAGAPVNFAGRTWFTPIQQAAIRNDLDMVTLLLGAGADLNLVCADARDLLSRNSCAAENGHILDGISLALISPLMFAMGHENFDMARCLLHTGGTSNGPMASHPKGENPRLCPIVQWNTIHLYMLKWWRAARSWKDALPQYTRQVAEAEINDYGLVYTLTEDRVGVNKKPCSYPVLPALQTASLNGNNSLFRLLVQRGGDIHAQTAAGGLTCLQAAAMLGSQELVELLLQMGARVDDYQIGNDMTILQAAVLSGSIGTVRAVLHAGANVNDSRGVCSALYHAAYGQDLEMCAFLLRSGALVDQENRDSPLIAAIFRDSHVMANLLLEARGNPNSCTRLLHRKWSESSMPHIHHKEEDENDVQLWQLLVTGVTSP